MPVIVICQAKVNGIIERAHKTLEAAIKGNYSTHQSEELPLILLGIKEDKKTYPAELR